MSIATAKPSTRTVRVPTSTNCSNCGTSFAVKLRSLVCPAECTSCVTPIDDVVGHLRPFSTWSQN